MMPNVKPEAVFRTCACGSARFNMVGYQNRTFLVCTECNATPFASSQKGHLGREPLCRLAVETFKRRLAGKVGQ